MGRNKEKRFFAPNSYFIFVKKKKKIGHEGSNLQTFSSACPYCLGLACTRLQSQSCSPSLCPGCHLLRRSCGGRLLAPGSGKRATGNEGGPRCTHHAQAHLRPPCHPPNATAPLEDSRREEQERGQMMRLGCSQEGHKRRRKKKKSKESRKEIGQMMNTCFYYTIIANSHHKLWTVIHWSLS